MPSMSSRSRISDEAAAALAVAAWAFMAFAFSGCASSLADLARARPSRIVSDPQTGRARSRVMNDMAPAKLTIKRARVAGCRAEFPQMFHARVGYVIEEPGTAAAGSGEHFHRDSLRPGGTISGPTMMALADFAMYVAILASIGWVPLAVTTNLNINFLRKPAAARPRGRGAADQARQTPGSRRDRRSTPTARRRWSRTRPRPIRFRRRAEWR